MNKTRILVFTGLFVALEIVLTRFLSYQTASLRIGFGFLPVALSSIMFGPLIGGLTGALADIIRMFIFPSGFPYFPGFTVSAFLSGALYGFFLYQKPKNILRISIAVLAITVFVDLGLNTLWLSMTQHVPFYINFLKRLPTNAVMLVIRIILIQGVWRYIGIFIEQNLFDSRSV